MDTNPVVQERMSNFRATQQDLKIANSEYLPKLDLISTVGAANAGNIYGFTNDVNYNYYTNSLQLTENIFNGFSTTYKVKYQEARVLAAAYHYLENVNDIAFQTVTAYIDLIRAYKLVQIAKESLKTNEKIYSDVQELYDAGLTTSSEVTKIQSSLALARSNLIVQKNNLSERHFRLKRLMGRDMSIASMTLPKLNVVLPESEERATMIAIKNNPSIMVSNYNIKGAQALYHESQSTFYPIIDVGVEQLLNDQNKHNNGYDSPDDRTRGFFTLTWNLYNGGADSAAIQKNRSNIYRELETQRDLKRQTIEGLELSWSSYEMIKDQLVHLYKYKQYSEETLSNYLEEYSLGRRTLLDLLSAQNDLTNSLTEITNAEFDRLGAQYRILDAMGMLVEAVLGDSRRYAKYMQPVNKPFDTQKDTLPVKTDADNDTIVDTLDICDNSPKGTDNITPYGCEQKAKDTDFDGVADDVDQCPGTSIESRVDEKGCPKEEEGKRLVNDPNAFLSTPKSYNENSPAKSKEEGLYDYNYSFLPDKNVPSTKLDSKLMYENFDVIKRFEPIGMNDNNISTQVEAIADYYAAQEHKKDLIITVIGHSGTKDSARVDAKNYADKISKDLEQAGVPAEKLVTEGRADLDNSWLETEWGDKALNDRVLVTLYKGKEELRDGDEDGVSDLFDKCPDTPKGATVDENGCSSDDDDQDGVVNSMDKCPDTPKGYEVDTDGCTLKINLEAEFGLNSSKIEPNTMQKIDAYAKFLNEHPNFDTTITGHTSIEGNEKPGYNMKLSKRRAQSVKNALVSLGVSAGRIKAVGMGPKEPVASNDTEEGRAKNRRIEATLMDNGVKAEAKSGAKEKSGGTQKKSVPSGWGL